MPRLRPFVLLAAPLAAALCMTATVRAEDTDSDDQIEQLRREMEAMRRSNEQLQVEVDELKAAANEEWLTEARAEQIRELVQDVVSDADARVNLQQGGMTAGWADGFYLASPDGRFKLNISGLMQMRWLYNYHDSDTNRHTNGFEIARTFLTLDGYVFNRNLTWMIRGDFARDGGGGSFVQDSTVGGDFRLKDAWARYQFNNEWSLRGGQFKTPFNREKLVYAGYQLAVERSLLNQNYAIGYTQGVALEYLDENNRWIFSFNEGGDDNLANSGTIVGGQPQNTPALLPDSEYAFTSRYERLFAGSWEQFRDFTSPVDDPYGMMVGGAVHWQVNEYGFSDFLGRRDEERWLAATADVSVEFGGASLFASGFYHYVDSGFFGIWDFWGAMVQGSVYLTPHWEIFGRLEYGDMDSRRNLVGPKSMTVLTVGSIYYFDGHDIKWTTDIGFGISEVDFFWESDLAGYRIDQDDEHPQVVFRTQFQIMF